MKTLKTKEQITKFLHFLSTQKKDYGEWAFLHINIATNDIDTGEIIQFLEHQFQDDGAFAVDLADKNELFLVARDTNRKLIYLDQKLYQTFSSDEVRAVSHVFDDKGLEQFTALISPHIPDKDAPTRLSLKRFARTSNSIMVLDDDVMVIRQMEHMLTALGHVTVLQNHTELLERYEQYAPDILFLDIHLRDGARGPNLIKNINRYPRVNPWFYVATPRFAHYNSSRN